MPLTLTGTILVRNIAYHKTVTARYTLDDWNTTNDVLAYHEKSLATLPERFLLASLPLIEAEGCPEGESRREVVCRPRGFEDVLADDGGVPTWDRFRFNISLETYQSSIEQRTMWLVGRYSTGTPVDGADMSPVGGDQWWDNNSGNNYRIAFMKKVVENRADDERKQKEEMHGEVGHRRNIVFSAPRECNLLLAMESRLDLLLSAVFTPSKPFPAPPQISSSLSYPMGITPVQKEQAAASHAALTQRLKKFGFTNYAAPSSAGTPTVPRDEQDEGIDRTLSSELESSTANTSTDSTPLQTPTQDSHGLHFEPAHNVNENVLFHDGPRRDDEEQGRLSWDLRGNLNLQMQDGYPATIMPPMPSTDDEHSIPTNPMETGKGRGRATAAPPTTQTGLGVEMGTSPPFSLLAGMELRNGMFASKDSLGLHWPWAGEHQESTHPNIIAPKPTHASAPICASSPTQGSSSPLVPPQRKKVHLPNQAPIGRTGSPSSKGGNSSGTGSGSDTGGGRRPGRTSTKTARPKLVSPQPWPPAPQHQHQLRQVMSPPPPSFASQRIFEIKADDDEPAQSSSSPHNASPPETSSPASPAHDAGYQAFIRKWCYEKAPAPKVGTGPPRKAERIGALTPDVEVH